MKIRLYSDLHLEFAPYQPYVLDDEDVVVLAGDIGNGVEGINFGGLHFAKKGIPTFFVPGNHDYYGYDLHQFPEIFKVKCHLQDVKGLLAPGDFHRIGDTIFMGGTLWTDFRLYGDHDYTHAKAEAGWTMADYNYIRKNSNRAGCETIKPEDTEAAHKSCLAGMEQVYDRFKDECDFIVITHHLPSQGSVHERYIGDSLNPAFASNLDGWIVARPKIKLWMHGHTHCSFDYKIGNCRVVANPRGYSRPGSGTQENKQFNHRYVIEV